MAGVTDDPGSIARSHGERVASIVLSLREWVLGQPRGPGAGEAPFTRVGRGSRRPRALVAGLLAALAGCGIEPAGPRATVLHGRAMGTTWQVTLADTALPAERAQLERIVREELELVERQMSTWRPDSDLSLFNGSATVQPVEIRPELAHVVGHALAVAQQTDGAFDITVAPLVDLWGFGPAVREHRPPHEELLAAARKQVGYRRLRLLDAGTDHPQLQKLQPGVRLDLSALAKGYGIDLVAAALDRAGRRNYLIELGGELRARGRSPRGGAWRVGLELPSSQHVGLVRRTIPLADAAVATSGTYRQNFSEAGHPGHLFSHIIDPRTGRPVEHGAVSVSTIGATAMEADALATALLVMGADSGLPWAEARGLAATFVVRSADGLREVATPAFERFADSSPPADR